MRPRVTVETNDGQVQGSDQCELEDSRSGFEIGQSDLSVKTANPCSAFAVVLVNVFLNVRCSHVVSGLAV